MGGSIRDCRFWSDVARCGSYSIRSQDFLSSISREKSIDILLIFLHGDNHEGKVASEIPLLVDCGEVHLSFSQIA